MTTDGTGRSALAGRRVAVTRASAQAPAVVRLLEERGATAVVVPIVQTESVADGVAQLASIDPVEFDWLAVTSPNGASAYTAVHASCAPVNVAAVGASTAAELAAGGVHATLVPAEQRAVGLLAELPDDLGTVLVVQAVDAEPTLVDGLRARGASVVAVAPYRTVARVPSDAERAAALSADAVLFASGSAVRGWVAAFGSFVPSVVASIGPQTTAAARSAGIRVDAEATHASLLGLVEALESALERR